MQRAEATATVTGCMLWGILLAVAFPLSLAALLGHGHGSIRPTAATPAVLVCAVVGGFLFCPSALETHPGQYAAGSGYRRCDGLCTVSAVVCLSLCTAACNGQRLLCHCCVACCHGRWRFFGCSAGVVLVLGGLVFLRVPQVGYVSQPDGPRRLLSFVYMDRQGPMPLLPAVVHLENPRATYVLTFYRSCYCRRVYLHFFGNGLGEGNSGHGIYFFSPDVALI